MNHKQIANAGHEEIAAYSSRDFRGRMPASIAREKKVRNRAAKKQEGRRAQRDAEEQMGNDMVFWGR